MFIMLIFLGGTVWFAIWGTLAHLGMRSRTARRFASAVLILIAIHTIFYVPPPLYAGH